jgi:hypothetical protein
VKRKMRTVSKKGELKVTSHLGKYENAAQFVVITHVIQTHDESQIDCCILNSSEVSMSYYGEEIDDREPFFHRFFSVK